MKRILGLCLLSILFLVQKARSSDSPEHRFSTFGSFKLNHVSDDEAPSYLGKDSAIKYSPELDFVTKFKKAYGSCQARHHLSDDEIEVFENINTEKQFSRNSKCFIACMFKASNLPTPVLGMLKDGRIMVETLIEYVNEDSLGASKYKETIEYCIKEVPESEPDLCEYVYQMTKCCTKKLLIP